MDLPGVGPLTTRRFAVPVVPEVGDVLALPPESAHHARSVLRLVPGLTVVIFDGIGTEADARLTVVLPERVEARVVARRRLVSPDDVRVDLLIGLPKAPAMDLAVRMATELGVRVIQPVVAARSVVRPERADRWRRIVASAAAQCGRADLPDVREALPLRSALAQVEGTLWLATPDGRTPPRSAQAHVTVAVGPEGGWDSDERAQMRHATEFSVGRWTLRTDTAVAAAVAAVAAAAATR